MKIKCKHCGKFFCNRDLLEKHHQTQVVGVSELKDLDQKIQPSTGYGDAGIQTVLMGKLHEITSWTKQGLTWKVIHIPIDHNFTYRDLL